MDIKIPAPLKAALYTALWTFIALFGASVIGFAADVIDWANGAGGGGNFPKLGTLGYAAVSAIASAGSGLVTFVVRFAQSKGLIPGSGPVYPPPHPETKIG